jgi:DNA-binding IclR family transcriptional regulator
MAGVNVLEKAGRLLDVLALHGEISIAALVEELDEPRTTVYRLLESMTELGWVEQGSQRAHYRLGLKLFRLGSAVAARFDERQAALPVMEHLHEQTGDTVFLCIRRGFEAVCIERIEGARVQTLELRLGGTLPLHVGAAPRTLLAFEDQQLWDEYLYRAALTTYTDRTPNTPERVRETLAQDRAAGLAVSDEDVTIGIASIGGPIFDHAGRIRAAVSISGLAAQLLGPERKRHEQLVRDAAAQISHALGYIKEENAVV